MSIKIKIYEDSEYTEISYIVIHQSDCEECNDDMCQECCFVIKTEGYDSDMEEIPFNEFANCHKRIISNSQHYL